MFAGEDGKLLHGMGEEGHMLRLGKCRLTMG